MPTFRSFVVGVLPIALFLSLACSLSIQSGHAGAPVADTADGIDPLLAGERAPRFKVKTVDSDDFVFDPEALERPAIIITFRGGWCPYCNLHLSELRHVVPEIDGLGVDVLFLSGDRPELLFESLDSGTQADIDGLGYTILSDANANAALAFGIAFKAPQRYLERLPERGDDIAESSMDRHGILPVPAVYAVDRGGEIAFAFVEPDYKVRLPADELLDVAREIAAD